MLGFCFQINPYLQMGFFFLFFGGGGEEVSKLPEVTQLVCDNYASSGELNSLSCVSLTAHYASVCALW